MNIRGDKLYNLSCPMIMGVINVTPDSFYKESRLENSSQIIAVVEEMVGFGAQIIDVGGFQLDLEQIYCRVKKN